jgi:predicted dehydrogenase
MRKQVIRLGIIGAGAVVRTHHWPALKHFGKDIRVVAVCRRNYHEAKAFARESGVAKIYTDYHDLLNDSDVDAVLIAVPIELNGSILLDAIRAGKHILAEKPIAATRNQARRILAESARSRQVVLIGENFRYRREIAKAKDLIQKGKIGRIFAFQLNVKFDISAKARALWISRSWRKQAEHPGGFILDAGVHPVAALREILGGVRDLSAQLLDTSLVIKGPDSLLMQVRMMNGAVGQCFFCYTAKEQREVSLDFSLFGTAGVLHMEQGTITLTRRVGGQPREMQVRDVDGGYQRQWRNFCAAIRGEEAVFSTVEEAYEDLIVIDAALRSSASGKQARIPPSVTTTRKSKSG